MDLLQPADAMAVARQAPMPSELPSFFVILGQALRLDPDIYQAVQLSPEGIWIALAVVLLAALSESAGQSVVLFINRVRPWRFSLALSITVVSNLVGYGIWTLTIWFAGGVLFKSYPPLIGIASAVGLAYAPQIFSFFVLTPFLGNSFGVVLSLWSMLAVIVAIRVGMLLETWQAVVLAVVGWILLQTVRRTIGRPVLALQRWAASRAAGVALVAKTSDLPQLRRRPVRTWYTQLESRRQRLGAGPPPEHPPALGEVSNVRHTN
jgi:hypothetical protein